MITANCNYPDRKDRRCFLGTLLRKVDGCMMMTAIQYICLWSEFMKDTSECRNTLLRLEVTMEQKLN